MVVEGVITRLVRGGALVDILLESGEPAFVPLNEIPHKAMPKVRELISLAVAVTARCDGCIVTHVDAAVRHGASRGELIEGQHGISVSVAKAT